MTTTKTRKVAKHVIVYRERIEAQNRRFTKWAGEGKIDHSDTKTPEYQRYFGLGEYKGAGTEARVTLKSVLIDLKRERLAEEGVIPIKAKPEPAKPAIMPKAQWFAPDKLFWLPGAALRDLATAGDKNAVAEIARRKAKRAAKKAA